MNLLDFIADPERKQKLATATESSPAYLYQVATGWNGKRASTDLAQAIERESALIGPECVPKESLRPDVWGEAPAELRAAG